MTKWLEHAVLWFFHWTLDVCDCLLRAVQKGMPSVYCRSACNGRCTAVGESKNAMKCRKALLSEKELLVRDKVCKVSRRTSEAYEQNLHRQEQNRTHMISINTYIYLAPSVLHFMRLWSRNLTIQCSGWRAFAVTLFLSSLMLLVPGGWHVCIHVYTYTQPPHKTYMWQSRVEIEHYSAAYCECITTFESRYVQT